MRRIPAWAVVPFLLLPPRSAWAQQVTLGGTAAVMVNDRGTYALYGPRLEDLFRLGPARLGAHLTFVEKINNGATVPVPLLPANGASSASISGSRWLSAGPELVLGRLDQGPHAVASLDLANGTLPDNSRWAVGYSVGVGYVTPVTPWLSVGAEGRYQQVAPDFGTFRGGVLLALHFGGTSMRGRGRTDLRAGGGRRAGDPTAAAALPFRGRDTRVGAAIATSIIESARRQLGTPYHYGGTGGGDEGYDCSGLIQFAYRENGVVLPRVSRDQAKEGAAVPRELDALRPADILVFAGRGDGVVTHVGLYLGDGRFIHSASGGVQESSLTPDDPVGRWWYQRWLGARRILED